MADSLRKNRTVALFLIVAALSTGCTNDERVAPEGDDPAAAAARCRNDPACRGQKCVDFRADLYSRGEYKAASMVDCSNGRP